MSLECHVIMTFTKVAICPEATKFTTYLCGMMQIVFFVSTFWSGISLRLASEAMSHSLSLWNQLFNELVVMSLYTHTTKSLIRPGH